jgi:hypothetical protein
MTERDIRWYNEHHAMLSIRHVFNWKRLSWGGVTVGDDHAASDTYCCIETSD